MDRVRLLAGEEHSLKTVMFHDVAVESLPWRWNCDISSDTRVALPAYRNTQRHLKTVTFHVAAVESLPWRWNCDISSDTRVKVAPPACRNTQRHLKTVTFHVAAVESLPWRWNCDISSDTRVKVAPPAYRNTQRHITEVYNIRNLLCCLQFCYVFRYSISTPLCSNSPRYHKSIFTG
jgi:hypothetical protein